MIQIRLFFPPYQHVAVQIIILKPAESIHVIIPLQCVIHSLVIYIFFPQERKTKPNLSPKVFVKKQLNIKYRKETIQTYFRITIKVLETG